MKSFSECIIVLDQGSSMSRAFAFDMRGRMRAKAQKSALTSYPQMGWAEHDALELLYGQLGALDELLRKLPPSLVPVAMGIASQRSTIVLWDKETGQPLCPALSWQDGRAVKELDEADLNPIDAHYKTGLYKTPYYSASKIVWCIKNYPQVKAGLDSGKLMAGPVASFILWHLTRREVFAVDPTLAQRTLLFNIKTMQWDDDLLKAFGIPKNILPRVTPTFGDLGVFEQGGKKIPIKAVIGDQQAAVAGVGASGKEMAAVNYGTGAFLLLNTGSDLHHVTGLLSSVGWQNAQGKCQYLLEGTIHAASTTLEWLKSAFGILKNIKEADGMCRTSRQRLMVLPALGGIGAPHWDYQTFTSMAGFNSQTKKEDIVRGCVEGIAYLVSDIAVLLRGHGLEITQARVSGGLSNLDYLLQFQSDLLQAPVMRMAQTETTALGAAYLTAKNSGYDPADWHGEGTESQFQPGIKKEEAEKLIQGWKLFMEGCRAMSRDLRSLDVLPHV